MVVLVPVISSVGGRVDAITFFCAGRVYWQHD